MLARICAVIVLGFCVAAPALAQTDQGRGGDPNAPVTARPDRQVADPARRQRDTERRAATRQKRTECRRQARQQKIGVLKRGEFVRNCMRGR